MLRRSRRCLSTVRRWSRRCSLMMAGIIAAETVECIDMTATPDVRC
jgi:hypothetical protein